MTVAPFSVLFQRDVAHGRLVAITLPPAEGDPLTAATPVALLPEERDYARGLSRVRQRGWIGGRVALRTALASLSRSAGPILANERGAPLLPAGVIGSVSHKETVAVALVATAPPDREARREVHCGVDVEYDVRRSLDIARHVLTDGEERELLALPEPERASALLLRFSAKEAIYKALDPFVRRYVAFREARVTPRAGGLADAALDLPAAEGAFDVDVRWMRCTVPEPVLITTAQITRA